MDSTQYKELLLNTLSEPQYVRGLAVEGSYPQQFDTDLPVVHITSIEDIQNIGVAYPTKCYFAQVQNIDASGYPYRPVDLTEGHFDGNGYTISNLSMQQIDNEEYEDIYASLFRTASLATIENVQLINFDATALLTSGIAGNLQNANVLNCSVQGDVALALSLGGISNSAYRSNIINCTINFSDSTSQNFAGVLNEGQDNFIQGCSYTGQASGGLVTGIVGVDYGGTVIQQCFSTGNFVPYGELDKFGFGILGEGADTTVQNCYSRLIFAPGFDATAGLAGRTDGGLVSRCYTTDSTFVADTTTSPTTIEYTYNTNLKDCSTFYHWDLDEIWECNDGFYLELRPIEDVDLMEPIIIDIADYESFLAMDASKAYRLTTDLDFTGIEYTPVDLTFGYLDGGSHVISNITVDSTEDHVGVFSRASVVLDLTTYNTSIQGNNYTGGLVGETTLGSGTIIGCDAESAVVSGSDYIGGIVGYGNEIIDCKYDGNVSGSEYVGGIAGRAVRIKHCSTNGNVLGTTYVGGVVGLGSGIKSYSIGDVEGLEKVGGFAGIGNTCIDCYSRGNVEGDDEVGGFMGRFSGLAVLTKRCYCSGSVTGTTYTNAFVGREYLAVGDISTCYYNSSLTGYSDTYAIGIPTSEMLCPNTWGWDYINTWECSEGSYPTIREAPVIISDTSQVPFDITMSIRVLDVDYPGNLINQWLIDRDIFIYDDPFFRNMVISKHDFSSPVIEPETRPFVPWGTQQFYSTPVVREGWTIKNGKIVNLAGEELIRLYGIIQGLRSRESQYELAIEMAEGDTTALEEELAKIQTKLEYYVGEFTRIYNEESRKLPNEERMYNNVIS